MKDYSPIPSGSGMDGWQSIPIDESHEKLVSLEALSERIILRPFYHAIKIPTAINGAYARQGVAKRLVEAAERLPSDLKIVVFDAWRPVTVQQYLYDNFRAKLIQDYPHVKGQELEALVAQFVSKPSLDPLKPSPHVTGGSVDVSLAYANGDLLDMGTAFDDFTEKSETAYYESQEYVLDDMSLHCRDYRRLLYDSLIGTGFTNYDKEWWHYDFGNQFWARKSGAEKASYSVISL
ncbi:MULTISPECIES: M15 family metallopeptidase [unclassified Paenibacillus]|uniref:M15 family metallopeptidase n=1 Tax=unclassified Paenibacillus TaxID=185978 RepID=UPI001AE3500E|nr:MULTISPECIES: M15 family metallopeptidase [unclassified Paenibacillus]MBP1154190.1 D-alanyl-D-alanine dipeptidase [Paenibacillus sp. PvP091]MBP1170425.1 D-alanyl-D-alanine dipeptidase [Paenibacillus sp. PvR098]MBP2441453.1 D-alanyl-D-alanine dipeptidase [Paenibacillus sp. PvP052]